MGKATSLRSVDTFVSSATPHRNYSKNRRMIVANGGGSGTTAYAYLTFARPFPFRAKIISATLTFRTWAISEGGTHTFRVRPVTSKFAHSRVTWSNRPSDDGTRVKQQSKTGTFPLHEEWTFDVTEDMQRVSDGVPWYGWQISTLDSIQRSIVAQDAEYVSRGFEPVLSVEWSDQPDEPASLNPDEGVVGTPVPALSFEYLPLDQDSTMQKVHVQFASSERGFAVPTWDSGEVDWTNPTVYPEEIGYTGATEGTKVFWRIRVMDQGGWSFWSPVAEFVYHPEPELTMTAPAGEGPPIGDGDSFAFRGYITDSTPQISWIMPEQAAYHVTVAYADDTFSAADWLWSSGVVESTDNVIEVPEGVIRRDDVDYRIIVRVFDDHPRISVANDHYTYSGARIIVSLTDDPAITGITDRVAEQIPGTPAVKITWARQAAADGYQIIQDRINDIGKSRRIIIARLSHEDVVQPDGTFEYIDHTAPPRTPYRYSIYPVENGKRGVGAFTNALTTRMPGIWLVMPGFSLAIAGDDQGDWDLPESSTAHQVIGAPAPTIIREDHRGYASSLSGILLDEGTLQPGLSAQKKHDRFLEIKADPRGARLVIADLNIPVVLSNMNVYPTPDGTQSYLCSFDFWQSGEFWWERLR